MIFKGVDFFPHGTRFPILEWRRLFVGISVALAVLSAVMLMTRGLNFGVDFKGGSLIEVKAKSGKMDASALREKLSTLGLGDPQVQGVGDAEALIRIGQQPGANEVEESKAQDRANAKVKDSLAADYEVRRVEVVGPAVSQELKLTGLLAVIASILGIMVYVWFRFEWQFAAGAVLSLLHDVLITIGVFCLLRIEFNLQIIAAILTIVGYSLNDTVVVFDRIREYMRKYKSMNLADLIDFSINSVFPRTILTSVTTMLALVALYAFGGEVLRGFTFTMILGVLIGTYSSIFIASPVLILLGTVMSEKKTATEAKAAAAARP